jgi:hypothetical protein
LRFQDRAYGAALVIIALACVVLLAGVALPPPPVCPASVPACIQRPDWGLAIVTKMNTAITTFGALLVILGAWVSGTLVRGASDAKIGNAGGQP